MELIVRIRRMVEEVLREHARDPRLAVFEVEVIEDERGYALIGETSEPAAAEAATVILPTLKPELPKPAPEKRAPEPAPVATPAVAETPVAVPDQEFEAEPRGKSKARTTCSMTCGS